MASRLVSPDGVVHITNEWRGQHRRFTMCETKGSTGRHEPVLSILYDWNDLDPVDEATTPTCMACLIEAGQREV